MGRIGRFLLRSQIITVFLGLCLLGFIVGIQTRPAAGTFPHAELFDQMRVVSYRESPSDTAARFVVQLAADGKVFRQYDVDQHAFLPPLRGRPYGRTITGTHYEPLRVRGHVAYGFWLDVPDSMRRALLPEQFEELYRTTLGFVKPVSRVTGVLGILSGYSVGYRLGTWNRSLRSRAVQERVLATPDLGRMLAREGWRRVLLEPVVMIGEEDASRFAAVTGAQRLYANFYRLALADSDGFVAREAERMAQLGRTSESRAMLAFVSAVRRAAADSVHLSSADFEAVERWATLLDRRGHWIEGAIPPPGEERIRLLGTLAWYGIAPPGRNVDRVWVGPRMLVREGDNEGFVADEIPGTGIGCPISWRPRLRDEHTGAGAMANAWLADRPEFAALIVFARRTAAGLAEVRRQLAIWRRGMPGTPLEPADVEATTVAADARPPLMGGLTPATLPLGADSLLGQAIAHPFRALGGEATLTLVGADSARTAPSARVARQAAARMDSVLDAERALPREIETALRRPGMPRVAYDSTLRALAVADGVRLHPGGILDGYALDVVADSLRAHGVREALLELAGAARALGQSVVGDPWGFVLRDPTNRVPALARVRLAPGQGIAFSGADALLAMADGGPYRGPSDARTGGLIGVAVLAADATTSAAWSGALFALDPKEARRTAKERGDLSAVLIERGVNAPDTIWIESDLKDRVAIGERARELFRIEYF
jgi:ApbE family protein